MIESISISGVATFGAAPEQLNALSKFNYLYGSNGTGKTTIGRVIADAAKYPSSQISWKGGTQLKTLVYNRDFVDRNFVQSAELKGVFTLGEEHVGTLEKITAAKSDLDALTAKLENLTFSLQGTDGRGGKNGDLAALESNFKDKCWAQKLKHDAKLQGGFEGFRNNAEKFKSKVLQEQAKNVAALLPLVELEKKAESVFGADPTAELTIPALDSATLRSYESAPVLKKRVVGKNDVDISAMIKRLGNSDWVREGRAFHAENDDVCPFCQQSTSEAFAQSLEEYFDEAFMSDSQAIDELVLDYSSEAERVRQKLSTIMLSGSRFLDADRLKAEMGLFGARIELNRQRLAQKKREASQVVELESLASICESIDALVKAANTKVEMHNKMVANRAAERATLTQQIWKFILEEIKGDFKGYTSEKGSLSKAIEALTAQISTVAASRAAKMSEIRGLEKQTTSIQPTVDGINSLLASFGFRGFSLAKTASGTSYKLVRSDGADAKATLSEGERTFVTFLYFFHLLKGSETDSGIATDRVVVFDDPVSSLDSDILFIVSSLIKETFEEVRAGKGHIKQLFVLTHNVYFHKEVTYNSKRRDEAMNEETFWIVRKADVGSKLERHLNNPIKTSYELLWAEIRRPDRANLNIQNTLRRILENYFKILGGVNFDELCSMFDGKEKVICNSLCSWIHDGSHYASDDLYVSIDDAMVDSCLKVFRAIFEKSNHGAHYKMMMGDAFVDGAVPNT